MLKYKLDLNLRSLLEEKKIRYKDVHRMDIPSSTLCDWSTGVYPRLNPRFLEKICLLAESLDTDPLYLIFGESFVEYLAKYQPLNAEKVKIKNSLAMLLEGEL